MSLNDKIVYLFVRKFPEYYSMVEERFFTNEDIKILYNLDTIFYKKYSQIPSESQIKELIRQTKCSNFLMTDEDGDEIINKSKLQKVFDEQINDYDLEWFKENLHKWIKYKNLDFSVRDVINFLQQETITPDNVDDVINKTREMFLQQNTDFTTQNNIGINFYDVDAHFQDKGNYLKTGFEWFDQKLGGGYQPGTLIAISGAAKGGKCVDKKTMIKVKNKKTNQIIDVSIEDFYKMNS